MKKDLVIFLDFDGVLHHFFPKKDATDEENKFFYYLPYLNKFVEQIFPYYDVKIVFATTWKENHSICELKENFTSYPNLFEKIIGATPNISSETKGCKWREAAAWISERSYKGDYLILDDYDIVWAEDENEEDEYSFLYAKDKPLNHRQVVCQNKFNDEEIMVALKLLGL